MQDNKFHGYVEDYTYHNCPDQQSQTCYLNLWYSTRTAATIVLIIKDLM